jgi:hypothetical protein
MPVMSAMPVVWLRSWWTVTREPRGPEHDGRYVAIGTSSASLPSSCNCRAITEVKSFVIEAILNRVSFVFGTSNCRLARLKLSR